LKCWRPENILRALTLIFYSKQNLCIGNMGSSMKRINGGFTLIELLIVISIIGILGAVAMPLFQMHAIRARLTEVENAMATVGSAVSAYHHDTESWPTCSTINAVLNTLGVGIGAVERIQQLSVDGNGIITATIQKVHPSVDGKNLILIPTLLIDGSISWNWAASSDFPDYLRPKN
jgi:type IV pilus assembly protein PilA